MIAVAVGWQVYAIHRDPLDLGLIGLVEFVPLLLLALPAGQLADVVPRRASSPSSLGMDVGVALPAARRDDRRRADALAVPDACGCERRGGRDLGGPRCGALTPELVPTEMMAGAMALRSVGWQIAVVAGPAVGGDDLRGLAEAALCPLRRAVRRRARLRAGRCRSVRRRALREDGAPGWQSLIERDPLPPAHPMVLGAILLDLFAVLFGGAIALAPVFARSILHVGPVGLGALRTAPAVGALLAALMLTRRPLRNSAGPTLLVVVALFGVCMVVFGLSQMASRSRSPRSRSPDSWT